MPLAPADCPASPGPAPMPAPAPVTRRRALFARRPRLALAAGTAAIAALAAVGGGDVAPAPAAPATLATPAPLTASAAAAGPAARTAEAATAAAVHGADRPPIRHGDPDPPDRTPGAIRIAAYNVLNLYDLEDDPSLDDEWEHRYLGPGERDEHLRRCENIAAMIRRVDADIVALQEVESLAALRWFRDTFLADMGYEHLASEDVAYFRGVENSVLSRFPIESVTTWPEQSLEGVRRDGPGFTPIPGDAERPVRYRRSPLRVDLRVSDDDALTLFVVHHKSGRSYGWMREMEALRTIEKLEAIAAAEPARNVIVLGDFNAAPWDRSLRLYLEAGYVDPLAHRAMPRSRDADRTEARRTKTHDSGRVIDYVLLNPAAYAEYVVGSAHVTGKPYDEDYDWRNDPYPSWFASDHHPVVVELRPSDGP